MKPELHDYCVFNTNEEARRVASTLNYRISNDEEMDDERYNTLYVISTELLYFTNEDILLAYSNHKSELKKKTPEEFCGKPSNGYIRFHFI